MKRILIAAAAIAALTTSALAQSGGGMSNNEVANTMSPRIDTSGAMIEGNKITHVTAQIDRPGYLVIHNKGAGAPPASLGHVALQPGANRDISIEANSALDPASDITLMLHYETNGNKQYDFGPGDTKDDTPVMVGDQVINVPVKGAM